jgi:serine/threonine-protein kinase
MLAHPTGEPGGESPLKPGDAFRGLEIVELLGRGGMGVVYKARQAGLDRFVALKILPGKLAADPEFRERFGREAKLLAGLNHPNLLAVHDSGIEGDLVFLVMEHVDGLTLRDLLRRGRPTPPEAMAFVRQLCDALEYAHQEGVVHRDIKPENILIDRKGGLKVADFGIAKLLGVGRPEQALTKSNLAVGTPHYMAPEQWEKPREVDHRADIYALGVVFYELLTGGLPIGHFPVPSRKVEIDVRLDEVVLKALEKEPEQRYQRAGDVGKAITRITEHPLPSKEERKDLHRPLALGLIAGICSLAVLAALAGVRTWK